MSVAMLVGCDIIIPKTYRYRMTVEVDTPQGMRSGSSVIEASFRKGIPFPGPEAGGTKTSVRGEAVAVDLPGGTLFALLSRQGDRDAAVFYAANAFNPHRPGESDVDHAKRLRPVSQWSGSAVLQRQDYPKLVRFRDIRDPKTVEPVDPDNLAASFGKGFRLKRIVIRMTDEAVTYGMEKALPSFGPETGFDDWDQRLPFEDPRQISLDDFKRENL